MKHYFSFLLFFLFAFSFAQQNEMDSIKNEYKRFRKIYDDYGTETFLQPNKYFHYYYMDDEKERYCVHIERKKYDSLIVLKLPDSTLINKSIYKIKDNDNEYFFYSYCDSKIQYCKHYVENQLVEELTINDKYFVYKNSDYKNLTYKAYYFGEGQYPFLFKYEKFSNTPFKPSTNKTYEKIIFQDGSVRIYDYKKDFPLSDEEFLKKIPNLFNEQAVEFLKDGTVVKNFDKKMAKNVSQQMLSAITKAGNEYKYKLSKGYSKDNPEKPVYGFILEIGKGDYEAWSVAIDAKTEKITHIKYTKGLTY